MHASSVDDSMSGTTAVTCLLRGRTAYVANVGDSRAVMAQRGPGESLVPFPLSKDQTPFRQVVTLQQEAILPLLTCLRCLTRSWYEAQLAHFAKKLCCCHTHIAIAILPIAASHDVPINKLSYPQYQVMGPDFQWEQGLRNVRTPPNHHTLFPWGSKWSWVHRFAQFWQLSQLTLWEIDCSVGHS